MNIESFRSHCMSKAGVSEDMPFGDEVLVFKAMGKMFALTDINSFNSVNLKCNPEVAVELRETYPAVLPGYHMNKNHWNTVLMDGSIEDKMIQEWVDESYRLVRSGLSRKQQQVLENSNSSK